LLKDKFQDMAHLSVEKQWSVEAPLPVPNFGLFEIPDPNNDDQQKRQIFIINKVVITGLLLA